MTTTCTRLLGLSTLALGCAVSVTLAACSSDDGGGATPGDGDAGGPPDEVSADAGPPAIDGGVDSGSDGASPDASKPNGGLTACTLSDDASLDDLLLKSIGVSVAGGVTSVTLHFDGGVKGTFATRYTVASTSPCVLNRDTTFGTNGKLTVLSPTFSGTGQIWANDNPDKITQVYPGAPFDCTVSPAPPAGVRPDFFWLNAAGDKGWARFTGTAGKAYAVVTASATSCEIHPISPSPPISTFDPQNAVDAQGRLHLLDLGMSKVVNVYGLDGATVGSYTIPFNGNRDYSVSLGACPAGVCLLGVPNEDTTTTQHILEVGADLKVGPTIDFPTDLDATAAFIAGGPSGPVFVGSPGSFDGDVVHPKVFIAQ